MIYQPLLGLTHAALQKVYAACLLKASTAGCHKDSTSLSGLDKQTIFVGHRVLEATEQFLVLDKDTTTPDSYEVLGVASDIAAGDVRKRYFKLSLTVRLQNQQLQDPAIKPLCSEALGASVCLERILRIIYVTSRHKPCHMVSLPFRPMCHDMFTYVVVVRMHIATRPEE